MRWTARHSGARQRSRAITTAMFKGDRLMIRLPRSIVPAAACAAGALLIAAGASPALAQAVSPAPVVAPGNSVLTLTADGKSTVVPDIAQFSAGVTTQGKTAAAALAQNAARMNAVIAALKQAGIAERDIQTSNLSIGPIYTPQRPLPDGTEQPPRITGYQASNQVSVRQRKVAELGRVIDTLVAAGASDISGPTFQIDQPDGAQDEARIAAMKKARARAELYARAAGLRVVRILTMAESGGWSPPMPMMYGRAEAMMAKAAPSPVAAGELDVSASVTVTFELAPATGPAAG